ncbi:helix-turn-helix domain-containing protein [Chelatococcus sp. GCM10030263]|uniref:helix-turn-helix domain-containing protein n=1 Tax=Chelatococcus sp. GCM10030263 TaxID=3273387 RepID=UPI00361BE977
MPRPEAASGLSSPVRSALRHMAQNYAEPITLKDLAGLTKLSPYQIIRAFRRELGITPHAWLIRHRVTLGTRLLKRGESIATVAFEVGFVDQTHFTRHFKRLHGETPARFLTSGQAALAPRALTSARGSIRACP